MSIQASLIKVFGSIGSPSSRFDKGDYIDVAQFNEAFTKAEASADETIEIHIKSDGGRVDSGNAFIVAMQASKKEVVAVILAAYSMGYFMCLGAKKIKAYRNSMIMLHSVQGSVSGSPQEMRDQADVLDKFNATISPLLAARTGLTEEEATAKYLGKEVYLTAQEALALGLIDEIIDVDAEDIPVVTASMSSEQVHAAFRKVTADTNEESFIDRIAARISHVFGTKQAPVVAVFKLSSDEEWRISCLISSLRDVCDYAECLGENSSNADVTAMSKELVSFSSKSIIQLVTMLYGEEETEMSSASAKKKISEVTAKVKAKQVEGLQDLLSEEITAKVSDFTAKLNNATASITVKDAEIATLQAKLSGKPVNVPIIKGSGSENGKVNDGFKAATAGLAHNVAADSLLGQYGVTGTGTEQKV